MTFCGASNQPIPKAGLKIVENDPRETMFPCSAEPAKLRKKVGSRHYILNDFNHSLSRRCFGDPPQAL